MSFLLRAEAGIWRGGRGADLPDPFTHCAREPCGFFVSGAAGEQATAQRPFREAAGIPVEPLRMLGGDAAPDFSRPLTLVGETHESVAKTGDELLRLCLESLDVPAA